MNTVEEMKQFMMECGSDEETATLLSNSYSEEEIKNINSLNKDLLSFMAKRESELMNKVLK